jgi:hypothetical protein
MATAHFQTSLAVLMTSIASLGAVVAYQAAVSEQDASRLERKLAQDRLQHQLIREGWISRIAKDARLLTRIQANMEEADSLQREAEDKTTDPARVHLLQLRAQGQMAVARSLMPFVATVYPQRDLAFDQDATLKQKLSEDAGFTDLRIDKIDADTRAAHERSQHLALAVAGFILGLFFCTLSQLSAPRFRLGLALLGMATAGLALGGSIWFAPEILRIFGYAAVPFALIGVGSWKVYGRVKDRLFGLPG